MSSQLSNEIRNSQPGPIVSIDELLQSAEATIFNETTDRNSLSELFVMNEVQLREKLRIWATQGFCANHILFEIQLHKLDICSDGQTRDLLRYVKYLRPDCDIVQTLGALQSRLPGMTLSYSYTDDFKLRIHVTRL